MKHHFTLLAFLSSFVIRASSFAADDAPRTTLSELEALTIGSGPVSVAIRFNAPGMNWTGTLLSRRAKPGEPSLTVTAFRHEPFGNRFLGFAMDGVADGPHQAGAKTVRDDVIGGQLVCAFTEMDAALDTGTHDLVFRSDGKTVQLFIDGIQRDSRSAEKFTARTYLKLYPHAKPGWKFGSDPDGGDVFTGNLENLRIWPRALNDDEIRSTGKALRTPAKPMSIAMGLYPDAVTDEQRMTAIDSAMPGWLSDKLAHDTWFPRYHVAIPAGMMFDTRCSIHGGRYHLFPTWRSDLNLSSGAGSSFRMMHVSSADLVQWRIEPFPIRLENTDVCNGSPTLIGGKPNFFFLRYHGSAGAPHRALPTDETLNRWSLPEPQPMITKDGEGYNGRLDSVVFEHGGHHYLTGTRRNTNKPSMAMPLYRSDDLVNWEYIGDFLQTDTGKSFNECPQIFHVGGKMAVAAFYPLRGRFDNYLVGRFENERFIPEASGVWDHGGHGHVRSFDAETVPDGRVIGWSTISVYAEHDALETARIGWKGMHSLPKEVELRPDNTLALQPAKEIEQLRGEVITSDPSKPDIALPANHQGQFELELTFSDTASIALTTRDGSITVGFDAETRIVATDTTKAPKAGSDTGHLFKTPALPIAKGEPVTVRLFYDRSVFEIYAAGHVTTVRHFPTDPSTVTATHTGAIKARAWPMKSIWTGMISAPLHGKP